MDPFHELTMRMSSLFVDTDQ